MDAVLISFCAGVHHPGISALGMGMGAMGMGGMSGVGGVAGAMIQVGELKLKIKVDEYVHPSFIECYPNHSKIGKSFSPLKRTKTYSMRLNSETIWTYFRTLNRN